MTQLTRSAYGLDSGPETDAWRRVGACNQADPDLFTSGNDADVAQARWVCLNRCQVREACLAWAGANPELANQAVYGGLYWTRPHAATGNPGTPRPSHRQPRPIPPTALPIRRRPEIQPQTGKRLEPHLVQVRQLYEEVGARIKDIAEQFGVSPEAVRRLAKRHGLTRPWPDRRAPW